MKNLINSYILSFVLCFMLIIFEPIMMYSTNMNDLWFDFNSIIIPLIKLFLQSFIVLILLFTIMYLIFSKLFKINKVFNTLFIIAFILFIVLYIQGNFLAGNLPKLDGANIDWNSYSSENIKSIVVLLVICLITIISIIKFGVNKVMNCMKYITLGIFAMLTVSLVTTLLTTKTIDYHKNAYVLSTNNINNASNDKNFFIFMVDAVDSRIFNDVLKESKYKDLFEDFTYYPDTMSAYPCTRDSVPFILSGIINENKDEFSVYETEAYDASPFFEKLGKLGYDINLYDEDLSWNSDKIRNVSNKVDTSGQIIETEFYREELKYVLFKYLPFYMKKYSRIETMDFQECRDLNNVDYYDWDDLVNYKMLINNELTDNDNKYFNFTHVEGGHVPFDIDENLNTIEDGEYEQKVMVTIKIIKAFLDRLKDNDVYDNSIIIVLADHGYKIGNDAYGRQNPILYIKGFDEHHEMYESDLPISYFDLMDAYSDLLDGKESSELFSDVEYNRKRRFLWYEWTLEDHMVEYVQTGKAWDMDTLVKTGKEFNR